MHRRLHKVNSHGSLCGDFLRTHQVSKAFGPCILHKFHSVKLRTGAVPTPGDGLRASSVAISRPAQTQSLSLWNGADEFTCFNDRIDAPPLPMPSITEPVRVVIVRHGQSTWNSEGRIQGSTDLSVLTEKGVKQAGKTRDMLSSMRFSAVFQSPLARARQTADVVLQGQSSRAVEGRVDEDVGGDSENVRRITLPSLREIDLYHFQGLLKHEGKALYGEQYSKWQKSPHTFELDSHAPVRELWHRASLAWQNLLQQQQQAAGGSAVAVADRPTAEAVAGTDPRVILVVAHNAINQALVATALGLPPSFFRRLPQNNAALSIIDLEPSTTTTTSSSSINSSSSGSGLRITLSCLNQSPDNPFKNPDKVVANVVLVTPPSSRPQLNKAQQPVVEATREQQDEVDEARELRSLAAVLSKLQVTHVLAGPGVSTTTVTALLAGQQQPPSTLPQQQAGGGGGTGGATAVEFLPSIEPAEAIWKRSVSSLVMSAMPPPGDVRASSYGNALVVLDADNHVGVVWAALGLPWGPGVGDNGGTGTGGGARLRVSPGGLTVIEFSSDPRITPAMVRCINNTAHVSPRLR